MTVTLDHFNTTGKRVLIITMTTVGLVLSHITTILRVYAKKTSIGYLQREDWIMCAALFVTYTIFIMEYWGVVLGFGRHQNTLSAIETRNMNLALWIIQKGYPLAIFCIRTSIILFYVRLFPTHKFRMVAWGIWIYTLLWTIGVFFAGTFQCIPVNYFWNKSIKGNCIKDSLRVLGVPNGVLAVAGDLFILCMPIPMILKLRMSLRRKLALLAVMLCGSIVICVSIVRVIAIASIDFNDLSFTQVHPSLWTYLDTSLAITCGNLPILRALPRRSHGLHNATITWGPSGANRKPNVPRSHTNLRRINCDDIISEVATACHIGSNGYPASLAVTDEEFGIRVDTEINMRVDEVELKDQQKRQEVWEKWGGLT